MANNFESLQKSHPCFGLVPNGRGRIHLPVSPACNIACRFCERVVSPECRDNRPGVSRTVLAPDEAVDVIGEALRKCPEITVAGIAGPGDTLATDSALATFRLVGQRFPKLIKCMSTNGLLLSRRAQEIIDAGIDTLTVTVNAVDAEIESRLNKFIIWDGKKIEGKEAAGILIRNQLEGIRKVADAGITVKVNTVLVPEINGDHIEEIARTVAAAGALLYNIIPLIPQYELADFAPPTCMEIDAARRSAEKWIKVFRHCRHCRADAAGVPGVSEIGAEIYKKRLEIQETFSHG